MSLQGRTEMKLHFRAMIFDALQLPQARDVTETSGKSRELRNKNL
jgi:hypothetical protein